jgi:predicted Zn-dependent peptidase
MDVTRLPSGLVVVTDSMPHLQSASLGVWAGCGSRDEHADENGISHLLEHMAFKGTAPHRAADRRGDRGGRRRSQCGDQRRDHRLLCARAAPDVPLALDVLSDILTNPTFEPESSRARRTSSCRRSAPPRTRTT